MKRVRLGSGIAIVGAAVGVLLAVLPSAGASNRSLQGVVLARSPAQHTLAVSSKSGAVATVHARSIRVGTRVDIVARQLRNGTFQAERISTAGHASTAQIRNAVVLRQTASKLLVAAGGSRLSIRLAGRRLAAQGTARLAPGSVVNLTLRISSAGQLNLNSVTQTQGTTGTTGPTGTSGPTGDEGNDDQGEDCSGTTGPTGASGPTGTSGEDDQGENEDDCGTTGTTGPTGTSGDEGDNDQGDDDSGDGGGGGD